MSRFHTDARPAQDGLHPDVHEQRRAPGAAGAAVAGRCTRRAAVRLLSAGVLAAPALWRAPSTLAIKGWCRKDPIVKIGDLTVQIVLSSNAAIQGRATGPTQLVIRVPPGVATRFVANDPGFGHLGYDVQFVESHQLVASIGTIGVVLEAYVPAENPPEGPLPLVLEFYPRGGGQPVVERAEGVANAWISLQASLAARPGQAVGTPADEHTIKGRSKKVRGKK